jgi:transcriptional regulator with XRE-family HTH domain
MGFEEGDHLLQKVLTIPHHEHERPISSSRLRIRSDVSTSEMLLQEIQERMAREGIDRAVLSRLETGKNLNPTFATLSRYAWALGKTLSIMLAEREKETGKKTTDQTAQKSRKAQ